jgi:hypothetical protein
MTICACFMILGPMGTGNWRMWRSRYKGTKR